MTDIQIEKTIHLAAPQSRVWAFLTQAKLIGKWFNASDSDMVEGQPFKLAERDSGEVLCWGTVLEMEAPRRMVWDFTVGPANGHMSRVEWILEPTHDGTTLTLRHSGLPQDADGFGLILALDKGWHGFLNTLYTAVALQDYSASIVVPTDPAKVMTAIITNMTQWWSDRVELSENGFTIHFNKSHLRWEYQNADRLVWQCVDAHMIIEDVADTTEWLGTRLIWAIEAQDQGCKITLTHEGLNERLDCLDVCTRGWQHFFEKSLKAHLSGEPAAPQTHENT